MKTDYLIVGSGLSALVFGALMSKSGKTVRVLEAHEHPGGFGHSFTMSKKYTFNAQLHYVWDCGEGHTVNRVLKQLDLDRTVTFDRYDPTGFDHMRMPDYAIDIPSDSAELVQRLVKLFPADAQQLAQFVTEIKAVRAGLRYLTPPIQPLELLKHLGDAYRALRYLHSTLQDVFDKFKIPQAAQTLLALQWPDFLLPPDRLSFYAWVILFTGYQEGAFYPTQHFEQVINALVKAIEDGGGEVLLDSPKERLRQPEVTDFLVVNKTVTGAKATDLHTQTSQEYLADTIICNIDPKQAAAKIGIEKFSPAVQKKLNYDYSPSNFMAYCVVQGIDLRDYGFGKWNTFHSGDVDLNVAFVGRRPAFGNRMYDEHDYSNPSFAITTPRNMGLDRLDRETSLKNFYFCNASSGYPGFAPTFWTGALLYQRLSGDLILN